MDIEENRPMAEKESQIINFDAALGILRLSKCFHRTNQNLTVYFCLQQGSLKMLNTIGARTESTDLILSPSTQMSSLDTAPLNREN
jgi:hypothetical protein